MPDLRPGFAVQRLGCALALLALCAAVPRAAAQKENRPPPDFAPIGTPDPAEGRGILEAFRRQGIDGDYYLEFELQVLPRRGAEQVLHGKLWGGRNAAGPISRVSVWTPAPGGAPGTELRLLIQSGPDARVWRWTAGTDSPVEAPDAGTLFEPVAGTGLTAFDLQMPFLYWPASVYEGLARMHGRPAHRFLFTPPADVAARNPALRGVRAYLDTQYTALVQAEMLGGDGRPLRTLSILDLKKVAGRWIVKSVDLRDEATRNKTRFAVTAAALDQHFPPETFDPKALSRPAAAPDGPAPLGP